MSAALNAAAGVDAYTLSDRGAWLSFRNMGPLVVLHEGDALLVNRHDVIPLNPEKHPVPKQSVGKARRAMVAIVRGTGGNGA
jgi:tungstate transport system substrate-binding protein